MDYVTPSLQNKIDAFLDQNIDEAHRRRAELDLKLLVIAAQIEQMELDRPLLD